MLNVGFVSSPPFKGFPMRKTAPLGEIIATAFDEAARLSTDPREVPGLAMRAITQILRTKQSASIPY